MRRIFQIDGTDNGVISVGERETIEQIAVCIQQGETETQILLSRAAFTELCGLQYSVHFHETSKEVNQDNDQHLQVV